MNHSELRTQLMNNGFLLIEFPFSSELKSLVESSDFLNLDRLFLKELSNDGRYFHFFKQFFEINRMEHIIALREAPLDDDGIWHDDGSRHFGFSLSLNLNPETISGGQLLFKAKEDNNIKQFGPLPFGEVIIFLSGLYGYEHKVNQVTAGKRLVIAGWGYRD